MASPQQDWHSAAANRNQTPSDKQSINAKITFDAMGFS
jgi:hypothetical protein